MVVDKTRVPAAALSKSRIAQSATDSTRLPLPSSARTRRESGRQTSRASDQAPTSSSASGIPGPRASGRAGATRLRVSSSSVDADSTATRIAKQGVRSSVARSCAPSVAVVSKSVDSHIRGARAVPSTTVTSTRPHNEQPSSTGQSTGIPSPLRSRPTTIAPARRPTTSVVPMPRETTDPRCQSTLEYARSRAAASRNAVSGEVITSSSARATDGGVRGLNSNAQRSLETSGRGAPTASSRGLPGSVRSTMYGSSRAPKVAGRASTSTAPRTLNTKRNTNVTGANRQVRSIGTARAPSKPPTPIPSPSRINQNPLRPSDPNGRRAPPTRLRPSDPIGLVNESPARCPQKMSMLPRVSSGQNTPHKRPADGAPASRRNPPATRMLHGTTIVEERSHLDRSDAGLRATPSRVHPVTPSRPVVSLDGANRGPLVESPYARGANNSAVGVANIRVPSTGGRRLDLQPSEDDFRSQDMIGLSNGAARVPDRLTDHSYAQEDDGTGVSGREYLTPTRNHGISRIGERLSDVADRHLSTGSDRNLSTTSTGSRNRFSAIESFRKARRASAQQSASQQSTPTHEGHRDEQSYGEDLQGVVATDSIDMRREMSHPSYGSAQPQKLRTLLEQLPQTNEPSTPSPKESTDSISSREDERFSSAPWASNSASSVDTHTAAPSDPLASEHADALRSSRTHGVSAALDNQPKHLPDRIEGGPSTLPDRIDPRTPNAPLSTPRSKRRKNSRFCNIEDEVDLSEVNKLKESLNARRTSADAHRTPTLRRSSVGTAVTGSLTLENLYAANEKSQLDRPPLRSLTTNSRDSKYDTADSISPIVYTTAVFTSRFGNLPKLEEDDLGLENDEDDVEDLGATLG